ncbi:uncharacterized protein LOC110442690 [Mizuhopecten yessoensis]|uniref:Uncharacterized protein n=1 Tax=Mizuhopecten yessoensis TaxID=6573 RepID=A0A210PGL8_MIZYE|nr:uncharacterized protein LOC110442690 [Mizuhopecten yessoensis]OWF35642.1 hypothetical protein KP79_PYT19263 [Mizuhopecten yessoensis]
MADKSGYPGGNMPPAYQQPQGAYYPSGPVPPPYSAAPQPAYPAPAGPTIIVQQRVVAPPPKNSHGILGFLSKEVDAMGRMTEREINWVANKAVGHVDQNAISPVLDHFKTNNIVQLISRASGRTLQIVAAPTGHLVVDGAGLEGPNVPNAVWTVINEGKNQVRLHNNNNYLAIVNGNTVLVNMPPGAVHGVETLLQLSLAGRQFVTIMSKKVGGQYVGVIPSGQLKSALATGGGDHGQFGVRLIYSPYPPQAGLPRK